MTHPEYNLCVCARAVVRFILTSQCLFLSFFRLIYLYSVHSQWNQLSTDHITRSRSTRSIVRRRNEPIIPELRLNSSESVPCISAVSKRRPPPRMLAVRTWRYFKRSSSVTEAVVVATVCYHIEMQWCRPSWCAQLTRLNWSCVAVTRIAETACLITSWRQARRRQWRHYWIARGNFLKWAATERGRNPLNGQWRHWHVVRPEGILSSCRPTQRLVECTRMRGDMASLRRSRGGVRRLLLQTIVRFAEMLDPSSAA